jgi:hypothetical protein
MVVAALEVGPQSARVERFALAVAPLAGGRVPLERSRPRGKPLGGSVVMATHRASWPIYAECADIDLGRGCPHRGFWATLPRAKAEAEHRFRDGRGKFGAWDLGTLRWVFVESINRWELRAKMVGSATTRFVAVGHYVDIEQLRS